MPPNLEPFQSLPADQLILQIIGFFVNAVTLFAVAVIVLAVSVARYLSTARIKNLTDASKSALSKSHQDELRNVLFDVIKNKLERIGTPFISRYRNTSKAHRILFLAGSGFALIAISLFLILSSWESATNVVPSVAADVVVAAPHGLNHVVTTLILSMVFVVIVSVVLAFVIAAYLFIFRRMKCVFMINRGDANVDEPINLEKYDIAICSVGVFFPVLFITLISYMFHYQGVFNRYKAKMEDSYQEIVTVGISEPVFHPELIKTTFQQKINLDNYNETERFLVAASIIGHYLSQDSTLIDTETEALTITYIIYLVTGDLSQVTLFLNEEYNKKKNGDRRNALVASMEKAGSYSSYWERLNEKRRQHSRKQESSLRRLRQGELYAVIEFLGEDQYDKEVWEQSVVPLFPDFQKPDTQTKQTTNDTQEALVKWLYNCGEYLAWDAKKAVFVFESNSSGWRPEDCIGESQKHTRK